MVANPSGTGITINPLTLGLGWFATNALNVIEEGAIEGLNSEIDWGQQSVLHKNEVSLMGVRNHNAPFRIEESDFSANVEPGPTAFCKKTVDMLYGCRNPLDGRLLYYQWHLFGFHQYADKFDVVSKQLVVKLPPFKIGYGGGVRILVLPEEH